MRVFRPVKYRFNTAVDYGTHPPAHTPLKYKRMVSKNVAKKAKHMTVQMKPYTFGPYDPISILGFLNIFKLVCDTTGVNEGAAMRMIHFFLNKSVSAVLNARLSAGPSPRKPLQETTVKLIYLTIYPQVVNFFPGKYGTSEIIAETDSAIIRFAQPVGMNP